MPCPLIADDAAAPAPVDPMASGRRNLPAPPSTKTRRAGPTSAGSRSLVRIRVASRWRQSSHASTWESNCSDRRGVEVPRTYAGMRSQWAAHSGSSGAPSCELRKAWRMPSRARCSSTAVAPCLAPICRPTASSGWPSASASHSAFTQRSGSWPSTRTSRSTEDTCSAGSPRPRPGGRPPRPARRWSPGPGESHVRRSRQRPRDAASSS